MELIIGIDEAGLGPVYGPMVVAGVCIEQANIERLKKLGAKDSKLFGNGKPAREKRIKTWKKIKPHLQNSSFRIINAEDLDSAFTNNIKMHELELAAIREILDELKYTECGTVHIPAIGFLKKEKVIPKCGFLAGQNVTYEIDAERKFITVAAASILAKVTRDSEVEKLCRKNGAPYVHGYANKTTADFLKKYYNRNKCLPEGVRKTRDWEPLKEIIEDMKNKTIENTNNLKCKIKS